ncbi:MAG: hypothetical protein ACREU8_10455 [Gammaproteobacteria bacterium]
MATMVIVETSVFSRRIQELLSDDEYLDLQEALVTRPNLGDLIPGSGGLRKMRWGLKSRGKRGGVRVIYYWAVTTEQLRMLYVYPKGRQEGLTPAQLQALRGVVERWDDE